MASTLSEDHTTVNFTHTGDNTGRKKLRVAVTGFGPFRNVAVNPSWQCLLPLQGAHLVTERGQTIELQCTELPVTYQDIEAYCETWHTFQSNPAALVDVSVQQPFDIFVHVGVSPMRPHLSLETQARRSGYDRPDAAEQPAGRYTQAPSGVEVSGFTGKSWANEDLHDSLLSNYAVEELYRKLLQQGYDNLQMSTQAGLYLCEYMHYCSLASSLKEARRRQRTPIPVVFLHVPLAHDTAALASLTSFVQNLIRTLADMYMEKI